MEKLVATRISYNLVINMYYIRADGKDYQGCMEYVDDKFILQYFSEKYIIEFKDYNVTKEWLKAIIQRYYFGEKDLSLNYEKLNNDLPFISLEILCVKFSEYLIKVKSTKNIFNYDINNYYIAYMENDFRYVKLFRPIKEGKLLKTKKEILKKCEKLSNDIINF